MGRTVAFYYDLSSPYAYLATAEMQRLSLEHAASGQLVDVIWRPFLLGGLFKLLGSSLVPFDDATPNKRAILRKDIFRCAELAGLPLRWPDQFPMRTMLPMRVLTQIEAPLHAAVARHLFHAAWAENQPIWEPGVLRALLDSQGLDAETLLSGAETPGVKQQLIAATQEAFERGACGAPTFVVGQHLVWGADRIDHVRRLLGGWQPLHG